MINIKFINATSVQLIDSTTSAVADPTKIQYTIEGDFPSIVFTCNSNTFSKNNRKYYYFSIEGTDVALSGQITDVTEPCQYWNLFKGQTAIIDATDLELTSLSTTSFCYANMFKDCINLINSPTISATTLDDWCYQGMFAGCTSLATAPALIATTLAPYCYFAMFYGCSSLITPPNLPAQTLTNWCYGSMFFNCTSLTSISSNFTSWNSAGNSTKYWVTGIETNGMFYNDNVGVIFGDNYVPKNWKSIAFYKPLTFKGLNSTNAVQLNTVGSPNTVNLQYSKNNGSWTTYNIGDVVDLAQDETVAFSGANDHFSKNFNNYYQFAMTGSIQASNNIQSLLNFSDNCVDICYTSLFRNCTSLLIPPILPATSLASACYNRLFEGCTSLSTAPQLPATTLYGNCYYHMFNGCSSLLSAPSLPATTMAKRCYCGMFSGCTSLTDAPNISATILADECCWSMFAGCTVLTSAPQLPATTAFNRCYAEMFYRCTSLTAPPSLPANTLDFCCYEFMFAGCTALEFAPVLSATTLATGCYKDMFNSCTNLSSIEVRFTDWNVSNATTNWVNGVAPTGTFTCPAALDTTTQDISHVPVGWTVINNSD